MEQPIILGVSAILLSLLINILIWFIGHKKASDLKGEKRALEEENSRLKQKTAHREETDNQVSTLTEEIRCFKASEEKLREEITKLTNSLMAEVQKSISMQEISSKLARNEIILEGLESAAIKDKETIDQLTKQLTEKELITKENNSILKRLKEVFTQS